MSRLRPLLPWLVVLVGAVVCTADLWVDLDVVFAGKLSTDTMLTAWFHGRVAEGALPETLDDFDFPDPYETAREFPSTADALLLAPLMRLVGWPGHWNLSIALGVVLASLGAAGVAKSTGVGDRGVIVAGLLGALCRPLWFEAVSARFNAIYPGLVLLGIALGAAALRAPAAASVGLMAVAVAVGVAGLWVYPPWALLLLPLALVALWPAVRDATWARRALLVGGGLVAAALLAFLLQDAADARVTHQQCLRLQCPDRYHSVDLRDLGRTTVEIQEAMVRGGLYLAPWLLAPLGLLARRGGVVLLGAALGLAALSLGPCPRSGGEAILSGLFAHDPSLRPDVWCTLGGITDYGRFATAAALCLAVLGGQAAHALGRGPRWRAALAWLASAGVVGWVATVHLTELNDPRPWHTPTVPATARFLRDAAPGPAAELPFDRQQQFLSVLAAPGRPRVNPLKRQPRAGAEDDVVAWLRALGRGEAATAPSAEAVAETEVRWVLWDPGRCGVPSVPKMACHPTIPVRLTQVLGAPVWQEGDVRAWAVGE